MKSRLSNEMLMCARDESCDIAQRSLPEARKVVRSNGIIEAAQKKNSLP